MSKVNQNYINSIVKQALEEDLRPDGDITTKLISFKEKKAKHAKGGGGRRGGGAVLARGGACRTPIARGVRWEIR